MKSAVPTLLAVAAGLALAFALGVAVETFSAVVHPFPPGFDPNAPGSIPEHVRRYPDWVLAVAALAFNLSMLPYVMQFKIAMPATFFVACLLGIRLGRPASEAFK